VASFGLVHGAGHGAWCWERLIGELGALGHRAWAMDLPCDDPTAGTERYAEVVDRALPRVDDLILVGHSLGGLTIPLVAARRPVRRLVFLCALIPQFGRALVDQATAEPEMFHPILREHPGRVTDPDGTTWIRDEAAARDVYYHDCTPRDVRWAWSRLRRQAVAPRREPCPLSTWPGGERAYVLCRADRALSPDWSRRTARTRLGVEPVELDGSHSPFISRPAELAASLDRLAH
jgi:pimeloyl-ACP methyl ester carboxylesterase